MINTALLKPLVVRASLKHLTPQSLNVGKVQKESLRRKIIGLLKLIAYIKRPYLAYMNFASAIHSLRFFFFFFAFLCCS